jgi:hypothetical protein
MKGLPTETQLPCALTTPDQFPSNDIAAAAQCAKQALPHPGTPVDNDHLATGNKRRAHGTDLVAATFLAIDVTQAEMQAGDLQAGLIHRLSDKAVQALAGVGGYFHVLRFYLNVHSRFPMS